VFCQENCWTLSAASRWAALSRGSRRGLQMMLLMPLISEQEWRQQANRATERLHIFAERIEALLDLPARCNVPDIDDTGQRLLVACIRQISRNMERESVCNSGVLPEAASRMPSLHSHEPDSAAVLRLRISLSLKTKYRRCRVLPMDMRPQSDEYQWRPEYFERRGSP